MEGDVAPNRCWCQKTRVFLLPHSEDRVILYILLDRIPACIRTDGRTVRRNCCIGIRVFCIASSFDNSVNRVEVKFASHGLSAIAELGKLLVNNREPVE